MQRNEIEGIAVRLRRGGCPRQRAVAGVAASRSPFGRLVKCPVCVGDMVRQLACGEVGRTDALVERGRGSKVRVFAVRIDCAGLRLGSWLCSA